MDKGDWDAAEKYFRELANKKGNHADAGMYWQAYAQFKDSRNSAALKTLSSLFSKYEDSRWAREGRALHAEITGNAPMSEADELKLVALHSLMHTSAEKAIPVLKKTLKSNASSRVKETAMFILSQQRSPESKELLMDFALNSKDPTLQRKAIEILGMSGDEDSRALLAKLYKEVGTKSVRRTIINGMMMGRDEARLLAIAKEENDPELRRAAIEMLGVLRSDKIAEMYPTAKHPEVKEALINSMMIARDVDAIIKVIETEKDTETLTKAIQMLGVIGDKKGNDVIHSLWQSNSDTQVKNAILESWMIGRDHQAIVNALETTQDVKVIGKMYEMLGVMKQKEVLFNLYSKEQNKELKRKLMESLMIAGDSRILNTILETETDPKILTHAIHMSMSFGDKSTRDKLKKTYASTDNKQIKRAIIESYMASQDVDSLIAVYESEQDVDLRHNVIEMLGVVRDERATAALEAEYSKTNDKKLKHRIIESFMIMGNAKKLVSIFRTEKDPELKRKAVQMLSTMRSEEAQNLMLELLDQD